MGNIVGAIYWEKTERDYFYFSELDRLRRKYNLEVIVDSNYMPSLSWDYSNFNRFGVQNQGLWIIWYGNDNIQTRIKAFLHDASQMFIKNNIKYITKEELLPI